VRIVVGRVDLEGGLTGGLHAPAAVRPARLWRRAAPLQHTQNALGPEVLMDVDRAHEIAL
jgi:hypothetical protein